MRAEFEEGVEGAAEVAAVGGLIAAEEFEGVRIVGQGFEGQGQGADEIEAVEGLLGQLDDELRSIALWKLEGYTNEEIATRIGRVVPTVERRLRMIRSLWSAEKD